MRIAENETVEVAWSEDCSGPGWANQVIWVLVRTGGGGLRLDSIQPDERSVTMAALHDVSAMISRNMTALVRAWVGERR